ncbi:MAG: hypothetical protein ACREP6_12300 [Candidatus Binataceae bacterium]
MFGSKPPKPTHVTWTSRGEELVKRRGREHGRDDRGMQGQGYRSARDSTSLNPKQRDPIDPAMPKIPPA